MKDKNFFQKLFPSVASVTMEKSDRKKAKSSKCIKFNQHPKETHKSNFKI